MTFAVGFNIEFIVRYDLETTLSSTLPMLMLSDSQSFLYILTKTFTPTEKVLIMDIQTAKVTYKLFDVNNATLLQSEPKLSDALAYVEIKRLLWI